jgi:ligand-binding sensor domain-containing protein
VGALALLHSRLVAGFFDGGLAVAAPANGSLAWQGVPGSSAWGVNALLPAGGVLYVASLRGAARFDGTRLQAIEGPGAAFSLAPTSEGVAIGYGQGVLLPGVRLLSAFHGLPGNQALALASGQSLFVGTPSGLGAVEGRRVRWRVTAGEGRLPHSWVTALAVSGDGLYVGTYGGGVARRTGGGADDAGGYHAFPETEGLKVSAGCLVEANGRIYAGTDGGGLFRLSLDRRRFQPLALPLPSLRVSALLAVPGALYVGTDEGLARVPLPVAAEAED